jgi:hypothetical protein
MSQFPPDDRADEPNRNEPVATLPGGTSEASGSPRGGAPSETLSAKGLPEAPGVTKRRAKTSGPNEPRNGQPGFSVAEEEWTKTIPQPGHYDALIANASINPKPDIVFLNVEYRIADHAGRPYVVGDMTVLDAKPTNPRHSQSAQGKGRVKAIMEANGKPLSFPNIQAVQHELTGCRVKIAVGHKYVNGLPVPVVQGIVGPAEHTKDEG